MSEDQVVQLMVDAGLVWQIGPNDYALSEEAMTVLDDLLQRRPELFVTLFPDRVH
jgi:hypothetical protein